MLPLWRDDVFLELVLDLLGGGGGGGSSMDVMENDVEGLEPMEE